MNTVHYIQTVGSFYNLKTKTFIVLSKTNMRLYSLRSISQYYKLKPA
ncbi:MAG: hypothetical protein JWQ57_3409 [Mucilaginibacter sp.]|nr:hypothetical protein [Mucilaginibacter sp.]